MVGCLVRTRRSYEPKEVTPYSLKYRHRSGCWKKRKKANLKRIALNRILCPGLESNQHILANGRF